MPKQHFAIDTSLLMENTSEGLKASPLFLHKNRAPVGSLQYGGDVEFDTLIIDFPWIFLNALGKKTIEIKSALCINLEGEEPKLNRGIIICSDLIQVNPYGDKLLTLVNEDYNIDRQIEIKGEQSFHLWLKDQRGHIMDLHPHKNRLLIQFEINY